MQTVIIDPEFKRLIPPLTEDERAGLEESIVQHGCRDSLTTWGGVIVDGHNRFEICTRLDIPFKTEDMFFEDRDAVVEWIIKNQFGRRNLQPYDRSRLALRLEDIYRDRAKANQGTRSDLLPTLAKSAKPVNTREEIAKIAGVSHGTFDKVRHIEAKATPEEKADLSAGKTTINKVFTGIRTKEGKTKSGKEMQLFSNAMQFARIAISQLTRIREEDPQRVSALLEVRNYIETQLQTIGE